MTATASQRLPKWEMGFTLIELAIVLVVIGLLTGGIMAGKNLVRQTKVNGVMIDVQKYIQAAQQFQQKYYALPGDMANATSYWGAASGCAYADAATGTQTCNGDGNGQVSGNGISGETAYFWVDLADAGLIQGQYSGWIQSSNPRNLPVAPTIKAGPSNMIIGYIGTTNSFYPWFPGVWGHVFAPGDGFMPSGDTDSFTAFEVFLLDTKYDDGLPVTGNIRTGEFSGYGYNCVSGAGGNSLAATYAISNTTRNCGPIFITGF